MTTLLIIGLGAVAYVVLLATVLVFFAGADRVNSRADHAAARALQEGDSARYDDVRRAA